MSIKKDKYEISLWEDFIVPATTGENSIPEHYEERKIAIIGSDNMTAQFRAIEPRLVENINGTNTFTFRMFYTYIDNETGEIVQNPFLNLLVNERKVKVFWKNKWHDLIIKACQEDSNGKSITYTCKDLFINELSKNGFNLEFDTELENNQGTVQELGEKILDGSDWQLKYNSNDSTQIIQQKREEAVYEVTGAEILSNFTAYDELNNEIQITSSNNILLYYSVVQNRERYCQFLYQENNNFQREEGSQLVINGKCLYVNLDFWDIESENGYLLAKKDGTTIIRLSENKNVSNNYRAERLVRSQKQILDSLTDKYVYLYNYKEDASSEEKLVYGYTETIYKDPTVVNNLLVNYQDFSSTDGWSGGILYFTLYPEFTGDNVVDYSAKSYLRFNSGNYLNNGIKESSSYIPDGIQIGEKYIVRYKAMSNTSDNKPDGNYIKSGLTPRVCDYIADGINYTLSGNYFNVSFPTVKDNWVEFILTCTKALTRSNILTKNLGFFLISSGNYWLEKIEFFPLIMGEDSQGQIVRINPGEMEKQSIVQIQYKYYLANQGVLSVDDLEYLYVGYEDWNTPNLTPLYNDNFEKIRSITAKNSNRFNLIQTLAETFECWAKFTINHDEETGKIKYYDDEGNYTGPQKFISFHSEIGQRTGLGFIYGIDLKTISRTINSDQITSKIIVSPNNNEYAQNGFCTIARSKENYAKDTFILNFDYYISQGLLNSGTVNKDLYQSTDAIGYYYWLNKYNTEYDAITEEITEKKTELTKQESLLEVYSQYITSIREEISSIESDIMALAGVSSMSAATAYIKAHPDNTKVVSLMNQWTNLKNSLSLYEEQQDGLDTSVTNLKNYIEDKENRQDELIDLIEAKHQEFYNKYSRFIQEGSWMSEEYIDDNLYYLDAQSVLYTSSRPQISYNISVLRLSALEEFKNKIFKLGDIGFIQDTEFFGYTYINGRKTPYKEEVLVSEITSNFDSPENDSFKVQNYKTQFEDLFQRITATTQSLQYSSGEYQRAANAFTETGEINPLTLQNSFLLNQDLVFSAQNESVIYDSTGITVTDATNPNKKVKITSGGIFISTDGGTTWKSAIRGDGISTQYLTTGSINTNNITIMDGNHTAFRWDSSGISAYWNKSDVGTILNRFVRFDQFGIYGIDSATDDQDNPGTDFKPNNEDDIWNNGNFGLTWKGFFLKSKYGNGYITISSEEDIVVKEIKNTGTENVEIQRIKIGNLGSPTNPIYGIRISDRDGQPVIENISDGSLWLKNRLNISSRDGTYNIGIGYLDLIENDKKDEQNNPLHRTIDINNDFIVYEDGSMKATNGDFTGIINATGGTIGGLEIEEIIGGITKKAVISATNGTIFMGGTPTSIILTASLEGADESDVLTYSWQKDGSLINGETGNSITIQNVDFPEKTSSIYKVTITVNGNEKFSAIETIQKIPNTADAITYRIDTNQETVLKFISLGEDNEKNTTLSPGLLSFTGKRLTGETIEDMPIEEYNISFEIYGEIEESDSSSNNSEVWSNIDFIKTDSRFFSIDEQSRTYNLKLTEIIESNEIINPDDSTEEIERKTKVINLKNILLLNESIIRANLKIKNQSDLESDIIFTKNIPIQFGSSQDMATLSLSASGINASILNSNLIFDANGLTLRNGSFSIVQDLDKNDTPYIEAVFNRAFIDNMEYYEYDTESGSYILTSDIEVDSNKTYYFKSEDGTSYYPASFDLEFIENKEYYEYNSDTQKFELTSDSSVQDGKTYYNYIDDNLLLFSNNGNLILKGYVYAAGGEFNGTIKATDGEFNGTINATGGTLSNLNIIDKINLNNITLDGRALVFEEGVTYYEQVVDGSQVSYVVTSDEKPREGTLYYIKNDQDEYISVSLINPLAGIYSNSYSSNEFGFFISDTGEIFANNLHIGKNAKIEGILQIGNNCYIMNPITNSEKFILVKNPNNDSSAILIGSDGIIRLGQNQGIQLDGITETIKSLGFSEINNTGWKIDNTEAIFNNVTIRGSIKSSVLEYGEVQTVGGILFIRPSSIIKSAKIDENNSENIIITVENRTDFRSGDYCRIDLGVTIGQKNYQIQLGEDTTVIESDSSNVENSSPASGTIILIGAGADISNPETLIGKPLIDLGQNSDIGIGINSSNNSSFIPARALSMIETVIEDGENSTTLNMKTRLLLGKIPKGTISNIKEDTYGLYADNVYLKGSMVSEGTVQIDNTNKTLTSGINTESNAMMTDQNWFPGKNLGHILMWAGAQIDEEIDADRAIEAAPFKVDTYGNLYAGSGYFTGTIITNATITAAEIKTATLTGWDDGDPDTPALTIRDVGTGILFTETINDNVIERMRLQNDNLTLRMNLNVGDNFSILSDSSLVAPAFYVYKKTDTTSSNAIILEPDKFGFSINGIPQKVGDAPVYEATFSYNKNNKSVQINFGTEGTSIIDFAQTQISAHTDFKADYNINFGDSMIYKRIFSDSGNLIGYDLYIEEV